MSGAADIREFRELIEGYMAEIRALREQNTLLEQHITRLTANLPALKAGLNNSDYRAAQRAEQEAVGAQVSGFKVAGMDGG